GFFAVAGALGTPWGDSFLFAIGVIVALVPEALLPTVTLALAFGAQRMARRNALVRQLEAVETLGSTTFICMDKTGTLTRNELTAVATWTLAGAFAIAGEGYDPTSHIATPTGSQGEEVAALALAAARASTGTVAERDGRWIAVGDPLDAALDALARRLGLEPAADRIARPDRARHPFDPNLRRMAVIADGQACVKGAPEAVLPLCAPAPGVEEALHAMTADGLRVVAVAGRQIGDDDPHDRAAVERSLELLGLVGLHDPPRPAVRSALVACRTAGIAVAMVTGDHPQTAAAVARETGLAVGALRVVEGDDLPDDDAALGALLDHDGLVLARVQPEQKHRIARALRARGHVLAMTGDGVNDAPALREADIGVAMGRSGTDVAREAADLVLLDDDFATIVAAVECGRGVYANVRRFLTYHLTSNVAELTPFLLWALSGGSIPLAIGVLQILMIDVGTDTLPAAALGAEAPGPHTLDGPPDRTRLLDRVVAVRVFGVLGPAEALVSMAAFAGTYLAAGWRPGDSAPGGELPLAASGAAFAAIVLGQFANAFACRSSVLRPGQLGWRTNRLLLWAVATALGLIAVTLLVPPVAAFLGQARPTLAGAAIALLAPPAVLAADAASKALRASLHRTPTTEAHPWTPPATPAA
ncbi:MAG: cation-translocating P-type ATPase, partial [Gaiellales bacterium]